MESETTFHSYGPVELPARLTAAGISSWLDSLPLANLDYTEDALVSGLNALNESTRLGCATILSLVERIRPTALTITEQGAETHLGDAAFPLQPPMSRYAQRGYRICRELASAYERIIASEEFFDELVLDDDSRALVLHRAMDSLGVSLQRLSENYLPVPAGFWQSVYALYRLAVDHDLHNKPLQELDVCPTLETEFKRILLFSLANVSRFRPRQIRQIFGLLGLFADRAELGDTPVGETQQARFFLDLDRDVQPAAVDAIREDGPAAERRYLMTQPMVRAALTHYSDAANRRFGDTVLAKAMLTSVFSTLGVPVRRKARRFGEGGERTLLLGFDAVLAELQREGGDAGKPHHPNGNVNVYYQGVNWLKVPEYAMSPVEGEATGRRTGERIERNEVTVGRMLRQDDAVFGDVGAVRSGFGVAAEGAARGQRAAVLNSSATGYRLLWAATDCAGARVGELAGLLGDDAALHIGVIRWMSHNERHELMMGVELLFPRADAVAVWTGLRPNQVHKGLFAAPNARLRQEAGLLTPPGCFELGDVVVLQKHRGRRRCFRLEQLKQSSPAFCYYSLADVEKEGLALLP